MVGYDVGNSKRQTTITSRLVCFVKGVLPFVQRRNTPDVLLPFFRALIDGKKGRDMIQLAPVLRECP